MKNIFYSRGILLLNKVEEKELEGMGEGPIFLNRAIIKFSKIRNMHMKRGARIRVNKSQYNFGYTIVKNTHLIYKKKCKY